MLVSCVFIIIVPFLFNTSNAVCITACFIVSCNIFLSLSSKFVNATYAVYNRYLSSIFAKFSNISIQIFLEVKLVNDLLQHEYDPPNNIQKYVFNIEKHKGT